jgi:hypothetical protein
MTNLPDTHNPSWEKFLDAIGTADSSIPTTAVASEELRQLGIDVKKAQARVLAAVRKAKARAELEEAKTGLTAFRKSMGSTTPPTIPKATIDRLKRLIAERCPSETHAAYFRKLEGVAGEADLRSLLQDLDCLDALPGDEQDGLTSAK